MWKLKEKAYPLLFTIEHNTNFLLKGSYIYKFLQKSYRAYYTCITIRYFISKEKISIDELSNLASAN